MKTKVASKASLVFIALAQLLDTASTYYGLTVLGGNELNPIMNYFIGLGWAYFFIIKLSLILLLVLFPYKTKSIPWCIGALSLAPVVWNLIQII